MDAGGEQARGNGVMGDGRDGDRGGVDPADHRVQRRLGGAAGLLRNGARPVGIGIHDRRQFRIWQRGVFLGVEAAEMAATDDGAAKRSHGGSLDGPVRGPGSGRP